jgi:hypothetical protein
LAKAFRDHFIGSRAVGLEGAVVPAPAASERKPELGRDASLSRYIGLEEARVSSHLGPHEIRYVMSKACSLGQKVSRGGTKIPAVVDHGEAIQELTLCKVFHDAASSRGGVRLTGG